MDKLRQAAEQALKRLDMYFVEHGNDDDFEATQALRQALAEPANSTTNFVEPKASSQPEQEPVCFLRETSWSYEIAPWDDPNGIPVYIAPSKQEYQYEVVAEHADGTYTTKRIPKRQWVGLTADEIWKCNKAKAGSAVEFHICSAHQNVLDFAEAIEAKLKEKNGG